MLKRLYRVRILCTHMLWRSVLMVGIAAVLPVATAQAATAAPLNLTSMHFVTASIGWGTGDTAVVRTANGGTTWRNVTPPGLTLRSAFPPATEFLNSKDAWIGDTVLAARPGVYRTTDGGTTWTHVTLPPPSRSAGPVGVGQIDFVDSLHGWVLEDLGGGAGTFYFALYRTTDGGAHWTLAAGGGVQNPPMPGAFPHNVSGIRFVSPSEGWTSVTILPGPQLSGIFHSVDGGHTWRAVSLPMAGAFSSGFLGVEPPVFYAARQGIAAVSTNAAIGLFLTGDGGKTWSATSPLSAKPAVGASQPFVTDVVDAQHIWIEAGGQYFFTNDLGRHWSRVRQSLGFGSIAVVDYLNARTGWVLGGNRSASGASISTLRMTVDGGHTWTILRPAVAV